MTLRHLLLLSGLLFVGLPATAFAQLDNAELVEKLRQGGYVILVRHAIASNTEQDTDFKNLDNCDAQRKLTPAGHQQAIAIGEAFRALQIPTGKIYSSLFCRCLDTAELAFGKPEPLLDISSFMQETEAEKTRRVNVIKRMLATPPADHTNTILVTHSQLLFRASNIRLQEGHAAVFLPQGNDQFQFVDRISDLRWQQLWETVRPTTAISH